MRLLKFKRKVNLADDSYIIELKNKGFKRKIIVDFLIGRSAFHKLTLSERKFIFEYILELEKSAITKV